MCRVRTGFGKSWKVLEIDNTFFQDLESFGKFLFRLLAMEKLWIFFGCSSHAEIKRMKDNLH